MIMESKQAIHYNDYVINMIKKKKTEIVSSGSFNFT